MSYDKLTWNAVLKNKKFDLIEHPVYGGLVEKSIQIVWPPPITFPNLFIISSPAPKKDPITEWEKINTLDC